MLLQKAYSLHVLQIGICLLASISLLDGTSAANLFDWTPSVSLAENHGVAEGLCLDIAGFGENLDCAGTLQLHTCKQEGSDTQFAYDGSTHQIRSVNFDANCGSTTTDDGDDTSSFGTCLQVDRCGIVGDTLGLAPCHQNDDGVDDAQSFVLQEDGTLKTPEGLCLAKSSVPYSSRVSNESKTKNGYSTTLRGN
jgi:hypothetical protein